MMVVTWIKKYMVIVIKRLFVFIFFTVLGSKRTSIFVGVEDHSSRFVSSLLESQILKWGNFCVYRNLCEWEN